jgi:8-oxo-dGTP pyrophosphatase MutT (NUDIX family)
MIRPWTQHGSKHLADYRIFSIRADLKQSPRTGSEHEFFVIDCVNWVNVVALTTDNQVVLIEQFRHGTNTVELEVPGGMMDEGESSPVETAIRELREETGYEGDQAEVIGEVFPNPAIMSNTCYTVLIRNCTLRHEVHWDSGEDLVNRLVPASEIPALVARGKIRHSLIVAALYHFELLQRGLKER